MDAMGKIISTPFQEQVKVTVDVQTSNYILHGMTKELLKGCSNFLQFGLILSSGCRVAWRKMMLEFLLHITQSKELCTPSIKCRFYSISSPWWW